MDKAQRKRIEAYVDLSDREVEPVFVGRADLFETVASAARASADSHPRGQTVCLAGPPGIGKTAFIEALRVRGRRNWEGPPLLLADVGAAELHDPHALLMRVDEAALAAASGLRRRLRGARRRLSRRGASVAVAGFGGGLGGDAPSPPFPWTQLGAALKAEPAGTVLCVCVDEAQQLAATPGRDCNDVLAQLHQGRAATPAFALLAGLPQLPDVISPTISRMAAGRFARMRPLARAESEAYVRGVLERLGARGPRRRLVDWIVSECGGLPHHLRSAMTALCRGMLRTDAADLGRLDMGRVAADVAELRVSYYEGRLSGLRPALPLVRALLKEWGSEGVPLARADEDAQALGMRQDPARRALLRRAGLDEGPDLVEAMISRGLLDDGGDSRWRCPIPSLRQYALTGSFRTAPPPRPFGSIPR